MAENRCEIRLGDYAEVLPEYPNDFFDLIVTSPPYADSRTRTYGGIKPNQYVDWFLSRSEEFLCLLKPNADRIQG
jgi:site-specific DNA-methyltransferase (adenine-specific)